MLLIGKLVLINKNVNQKQYVDPDKAAFIDEKKLIMENLNLSNELTKFISDSSGDDLEAENYINKNPQIKEYGRSEYLTPIKYPKISSNRKANVSLVAIEMSKRTIKTFR